MLHLAFIFHMHQPYYKNLLTGEVPVPWVRLHGTKDYSDMVLLLEKYPKIRQTFNLVPSLVEQIEDYEKLNLTDKFLELSRKPAAKLNQEEKAFILSNFFSINKDKVISFHPRYYELYLRRQSKASFTSQDYLDLQVWFNLAWVDPYFRENIPELRKLVYKARFYTEEDKEELLLKQLEILRNIIPVYKKFLNNSQIEVTISPYYHPILPLLYNTSVAKEANPRTVLPKINFSFPQDAQIQIASAVDFFKQRFGVTPSGMWPSEEAVSEHILPFIINAGIKWIVTDEAILFKSLHRKKRDATLLYQPHIIKSEEGDIAVVFRDRNLSDLLGFVYHSWSKEAAVKDFMHHLKNIAGAFKEEDVLVVIAMDGENAWEYYTNDGHDFLNLLYNNLSEADFVKTTTINEYLLTHQPKHQIKRLAAGSWIYGEFGKWIGNPVKVAAWEYLAKARRDLDDAIRDNRIPQDLTLALKQMYILEGSDWFWWYGEDPNGDFDKLFRMHMSNFYKIIKKDIPSYLGNPI